MGCGLIILSVLSSCHTETTDETENDVTGQDDDCVSQLETAFEEIAKNDASSGEFQKIRLDGKQVGSYDFWKGPQGDSVPETDSTYIMWSSAEWSWLNSENMCSPRYWLFLANGDRLKPSPLPWGRIHGRCDLR